MPLKVDTITNYAGTGFPTFGNGTAKEIRVDTGNGFGSTNTGVKRFTNTRINNGGSAITYTDSATLGGSFTVNESGIYAIFASDVKPAGGHEAAITRNGTNLTSGAPSSWSSAEKQKALTYVGINASNSTVSQTAIAYLSSSDVIRFHGSGTGTDELTYFHIVQIMKI